MRQFIKYVLLALSIFLLYLILHGFLLDDYMQAIKLAMAISCLIVASIYYSRLKKNGITDTHLISLIILLGFIMRIGYMLYTMFLIRAHDIGGVSTKSFGHAAYILNLMINKALPTTYQNQFYHPPLFYFLGATVSWLINLILGKTDFMNLVDATKTVSCFASCATLLLCHQLCKTFKLDAASQNITMAILAFFPNFFLLAGRVNNDALVIFFMIAAILYTYYWYEKQSYKNTILLALLFGLGMMTKTSMAVIALFTGLVMVAVLIDKIKHDHSQISSLILKFGCFGFISLPLGLWYPIRNYILMEQPIGYVAHIPETSDLYIGDASFFQRFLSLDLDNLIKTPFADPWNDTNLPAYMIKSSLFGEFSYEIPLWIPIILLFLNIILIIFSLWALYKLISSKERYPAMIKIGTPILWLIIILFNVYFNICYPFGCTMDFRYIVPTVVLGSLFIGLTYHPVLAEMAPKSSIISRIHSLYQMVLPWVTILFCIFSFLMYVLIVA